MKCFTSLSKTNENLMGWCREGSSKHFLLVFAISNCFGVNRKFFVCQKKSDWLIVRISCWLEIFNRFRLPKNSTEFLWNEKTFRDQSKCDIFENNSIIVNRKKSVRKKDADKRHTMMARMENKLESRSTREWKCKLIRTLGSGYWRGRSWSTLSGEIVNEKVIMSQKIFEAYNWRHRLLVMLNVPEVLRADQSPRLASSFNLVVNQF